MYKPWGGGSLHILDTHFYHENEEISTVEAPQLAETPHFYYMYSFVPPQLAAFTNAITPIQNLKSLAKL